MTTVLLTGASGYIGKHITLRLLSDGYHVRASVRTASKANEVRRAVAAHLASNFDLDSALSFVTLDLESDAGWGEALTGVDVLMHSASPFPIASPKNEDDLIRPAVDGTLRALGAAHAAGVTRVILTSSVAAVYGTELASGKTEFDETSWSDVTHPVGRIAYTKSKTLAEKAAWDFVATTAPEISLTTVNPVLVAGAPLDEHFGSSVSVVERILNRKDPVLPDISFSIVDVKDVAAMHVRSITTPASVGQRLIASSGARTFMQIAQILKAAFPGRKFTTTRAPSALIRFLAIFDGEIRAVLPSLGKHIGINSSKAQKVFKMTFIPVETTLVETAKYLIDNGFVKS